MDGATKRCFKCWETKLLGEFYLHPETGDGRLNKCKDCTKRDVRNNRSANLEYYREYDRVRADLPHRVTAREAYARTDACRKSHKHSTIRWQQRNTEKRAAHIAVGNAIRAGKLVRQACEVCGAYKAQAHHDDYSRPLDVRWLCPRCHSQHHKQEAA